ncbi:MAG: Shikimate kinase [Firmicutes bacterium]|nr:Shikimate kinase [Bacillota bacterium]
MRHLKNIVLIGFMGSGKTSIGRLLAAKVGRRFIDVDKEIENEAGMTITDMFAAHGEAYFRQKEAEYILLVSHRRSAVIATGGGVVLNHENIKNLGKNGVIISLSASVDTILERTGRRSTRPLLNRPDRADVIAKLLADRTELYNQADYIINTDGVTPQKITEEIIVLLKQGGYIRG